MAHVSSQTASGVRHAAGYYKSIAVDRLVHLAALFQEMTRVLTEAAIGLSTVAGAA